MVVYFEEAGIEIMPRWCAKQCSWQQARRAFRAGFAASHDACRSSLIRFKTRSLRPFCNS
jgi:hypothetical protein